MEIRTYTFREVAQAYKDGKAIKRRDGGISYKRNYVNEYPDTTFIH